MTIIYLSERVATAEEQEVARSLEASGERVRYRYAGRWQGEVEPCDAVYTTDEGIRKAYAARKIEVVATEPKPKAKPRKRATKK